MFLVVVHFKVLVGFVGLAGCGTGDGCAIAILLILLWLRLFKVQVCINDILECEQNSNAICLCAPSRGSAHCYQKCKGSGGVNIDITWQEQWSLVADHWPLDVSGSM